MLKLITPASITATVKYPVIVEKFIKEMDIKDPEFEFKPKNTEIKGRSSFTFSEYELQHNKRFDLNYSDEGHWFKFKNKNYIKPQYLQDIVIKEFKVLNHTNDGCIAVSTQYILNITDSPFSENTFIIKRCSLSIIEKLIVILMNDNKKMKNASLEELSFDFVPLEEGVSTVDGSFVIDGAELKDSFHGKKDIYFTVKQASIFE